MSQFRVTRGSLQGTIAIPPSKSHTLRALLFGALGKGRSTIHHHLSSPDTRAMVEALRLFGATIDVSVGQIDILGLDGTIRNVEGIVHAGNSGIVLRFCSAIGALSSSPIIVTGDHSIRNLRPMGPLLNGLQQLGCRATSMRNDGYAPVIIEGPLHEGTVVISGEDSQPVSALIIAAAFAEGPIEIFVKDPGEKPWVDLTLHWLDRCGISFERRAFDWYRLPGRSQYNGFDYEVPGDFSSAAFPIVAALVTRSELCIQNVDFDDTQGDKELISVFQKMGAKFEIDAPNKRLFVQKVDSLTGIDVDVNDFIDAFPILAVVGAFAEGETCIRNGAIARHKECDRIRCITTELRKMGADIEEYEDGVRIRKSYLKGASLHSYNDHRVAMALAVAGLSADNGTTVSPVGCVLKSYPTFLRDFTSIGAPIREVV